MEHPENIVNRLGFALIGIFTLMAGCTTRIEMVKPGPPVPVVYGIFDTMDSTHTIKLGKSFAGEKDALELAEDPENLYYHLPIITLSETRLSRMYSFEEVNGIPREPGTFPNLPNRFYKLNAKLSPGTHLVRIILPEVPDTLLAEVRIMNPMKVLIPRPGFKRFYFYDDPTVFSWTASDEIGLYELSITLTVAETLKTGQTNLRKIRYAKQLRDSDLEAEKGYYNYRYFSDGFFASIPGDIKPDEAVDYRKPVDLMIEITAADTVVSRYLDWFNLEIDDRINPNGNIPGAIGMIGSKSTVRFPNLILSPRAQDSLVHGKFTRNLGFVFNSEW